LWEYSGILDYPIEAQRLDNGNTLIANSVNDEVIEVNPAGTIVWSKTTELDYPWYVERLSNGNTLIVDSSNNRVIEVNPSGTIIWECPANYPKEAKRLSNGNTLIAYTSNIIEVSGECVVGWSKEFTGLEDPFSIQVFE